MTGWTPPDKPIVSVSPGAGDRWTPPDKPIGTPQPTEAEDRGFSLFGTKPTMDPVFSAFVAPALNTIDYPVRAAGADIAASIPGVGAFPIGPGSRTQWQRVRDQILRGTAVPENSLGRAIEQIVSIPGALVGSGVRAAAHSVFGDRVAEALTPFAETASDILPFGGAALKGAREMRTPPMRERPAVPKAAGAGYKLAPEQVTERPGILGRALSASGKYKKFQELSYENQKNTDRLAARAIGLPPGTHLNEAAFDRARQPAIQAYREIEAAVPTTILGADPAFRADVQGLTAQRGILDPTASENPQIAHLRAQLLATGTESTRNVRETVADLRFKAGQNLRKRDDAEAHDLGMAQRRAAGILENAIERSIVYGPDHVKALGDYYAAEQELARYRQMVATGNAARGAPVDVVAVQAARDRARQEVIRTAVRRSPQAQMIANEMLNRFRAARQLFAKTYDLELATNLADGHVIARRVSRLRSGPMRRPLTGEMKQIADAYDAFAPSLQDPARTGYPEDYSILDAYVAGGALAAGHPRGALAVALRWPLRRALVSDWYQRALRNAYGRQVAPVSRSFSPGGYVAGTLLQPHNPSPFDASRYDLP